MPATPNIGQLITSTNTGPQANVTASELGPHSPRTLTTVSGAFSTTANGQTISDKSFTGLVTIKHDNVTFDSCEFLNDVENGDNRSHTGMRFLWCDVGPLTGQVNSGRGSTLRFMKNCLVFRCRLRGRIDLYHPWGGEHDIIENYFYSTLYDTTGVSNHMDPIQPPGNNPARWTRMLIQGNKFNVWPIPNGAAVGANDGVFSPKSATSGALNCEFNCDRTTFRDNYVDGNYAQAIYIINGDNNTTNGNPTTHPTNPGVQLGPPTNAVVIDNIFKMRRGPGSGRETNNRYGESAFVNFGGTSGAVTPTVTWGRNVDADTNTTLAAFLYTYATGTNHFYSKTVDAGPSSQYPTFYGSGSGGGGPDPGVVAMQITSPSPGTYTSGPVVLTGQADTGAGDLASNYDWYDYFIESVEPGVLTEKQVDRDSPTNNSGFTFNPTTNGVTFVGRDGVTYVCPPGDYKLTVRGVRKDGTFPQASVTVTFGTASTPPPPPTDIEFSASTDFAVQARPKLVTSVGGIPKAQVTSVPKAIPLGFRYVWVQVWDSSKGGTGEEVIPLDANNYKRRYE
jgi:hypothetical protein